MCRKSCDCALNVHDDKRTSDGGGRRGWKGAGGREGGMARLGEMMMISSLRQQSYGSMNILNLVMQLFSI